VINLKRESIEFKGTLVELKSKLNQQRSRYFHIEWISENEFKFSAPISNGTAMVKGNPGLIDGIKGYAIIIEDKANGIIQINMSTKLRIGLKLIIAFGILLMIYAFYTFKTIPILLIAIFPFAFVWMYKIYGKQEIELFEKVKQYLIEK